MKVQMLRRRRSEEGKALRRQIGDHVPFSYKQMEIDPSIPYSSTVTTEQVKETLLVEIWEIRENQTLD